MSAIEWTDTTWNPTTGCDRVSPGCDHCYALTMAKRLKAMGQVKYQRDGDSRTSGPGFGLTVHDEALGLPLTWRTPRRVFVNSMSDLLHRDVSDVFLSRVWEVMRATPHHTYQLLTKRHARLRSLFPQVLPPDRSLALPHVHVGVSAEDQHWADIRLPALVEADLAVRFASCEPLLGPIDLTAWLAGTPGLEWVIVGGESGSGARPCDPDWIRSLIDQCHSTGVPVFVKQLGSVWARQHGTDPKGGDWTHWPQELRVRQFPTPTRGPGGAVSAAGLVGTAELDAVVAAIRGHRYVYADEEGLQAGVAAAIAAAKLPAEREVRLSARDRLDVVSGRVGVEVKLTGANDTVLRQLQRYAHHERITGLVLVTIKATHRDMPDHLNGKPLCVVRLGGAS